MNLTSCTHLLNFPAQYEPAIEISYAPSVSRIEQPFIAASCALIIFPMIFVSAIVLYRSYRSRRLRKQAETLARIWKLDRNDQNNVF